MPGIVAFLGYNPLPDATAVAEKLVRDRTTLGMTQREAAAQIGVDQGTLARWERGDREPKGEHGDKVRRILDGGDRRRSVRRVG